MEIAKRVAKNTGFLYIRIAVNIIISLYSTRIVLDALGVEDFGIYNLVGGVIAMLAFLNSAMAEATQRFMAFSLGEGILDKQRSIFNVSQVLHFLIGIVVVIVLELIGFFLFRGVLEIPADRVHVAKLVFHFMVISTFFTIIKVPYDAIITAHENMWVFAILGIIHAFVKLGIAIYITYSIFDKLVVYGFLMALLSIVLVIVSYAYCLRKYSEVKFDIRGHFDKKLFFEMGSFASWTLLIHATYIVTTQGVTVVLNSFFGVVVNAAQGISNQVSSQLKNFTATMQQALNPVIVKKEGGRDRYKMLEAAMFGNKISFFVLSFLSVPIWIEMPFLLDLWLKDVPEFSVIFCRLQLVGLIIGALTQSFYVAIGAIGTIKHNAIWESLVFVSVLPISYLMFQYGASPETIYLNLIGMTIGISSIRVYFLRKLGGLPLDVFLKNVVIRCISVLILTFMLSVGVIYLIDESFIRLLIVLFLSCISFPVAAYFIGLNISERSQITRVILSFIKKH